MIAHKDGAPIKIHRGTDEPAVIWRFRQKNSQPAPLGEVYELTIVWLGQAEPFVRSTVDGALMLDPAAGTVTWPYTRDESALIPLGDASRYELMRVTNGRTRFAAGGPVTVRSWLP